MNFSRGRSTNGLRAEQLRSEPWQPERSAFSVDRSPLSSVRLTRTQASSRITPNQQIRGRLSQSDALNRQRRDRYADSYQLVGVSAGQRVQVELKSRDFDAYLQVVNARTGRVIRRNDDRALQDTDARLGFVVQAGVAYQIRVTSFKAEEVGRYQLTTRASATAPFSRDAGYGLVDAAKAVAAAKAWNPFADVADQGDRQWQLDQLNVPEVWAQGVTGQGITVAVLDTGVDYSHPDLQGNLWRNLGEVANNGLDDDQNGYIDDVNGWSFVDADSNDPSDRDQHGTHVAGTIAAANNGVGVTGAAYGAQIMPVRVIDGMDDRYPDRFDANVAAGIRYAMRNGARVLNLSLGNFLGDPPMVQTKAALKEAQLAGVVAVMASGNEREDGADQPIEPASFARSGLGIAVGAVTRQRKVADFSNPAGNQRLDFVVAPGVNVRSTVPGGDYAEGWNGTSMATAYVSGVVALMLSANPALTAAQITAILRSTAAPVR